jgi:hypothetical protein
MAMRPTAPQVGTFATWVGAWCASLMLAGVVVPSPHGQTATRSITTRGLTVVNEKGGQVVYDTNAHVYWLADANFAASLEGRRIQTEMGVTGIGLNGTMDYPTARKWVQALNAYDHGAGWLGHHDWRLPASPMKDTTCGAMGPQGASFGALCQDNLLGKLYYVGLGRTFPESVAPDFNATVEPFRNLQLSYYWTAASGGLAGKKIFSFASGSADATTTVDSFYYVLPMVPRASGPIGGSAPRCPTPAAVVPYTDGPAANQAVYECNTGSSWPANANLAALDAFGLTGEAAGIEERWCHAVANRDALGRSHERRGPRRGLPRKQSLATAGFPDRVENALSQSQTRWRGCQADGHRHRRPVPEPSAVLLLVGVRAGLEGQWRVVGGLRRWECAAGQSRAPPADELRLHVRLRHSGDRRGVDQVLRHRVLPRDGGTVRGVMCREEKRA